MLASAVPSPAISSSLRLSYHPSCSASSLFLLLDGREEVTVVQIARTLHGISGLAFGRKDGTCRCTHTHDVIFLACSMHAMYCRLLLPCLS